MAFLASRDRLDRKETKATLDGTDRREIVDLQARLEAATSPMGRQDLLVFQV